MGHDNPKHTSMTASSISAAIAHSFPSVREFGPNTLSAIRTMVATHPTPAIANNAVIRTFFGSAPPETRHIHTRYGISLGIFHIDASKAKAASVLFHAAFGNKLIGLRHAEKIDAAIR